MDIKKELNKNKTVLLLMPDKKYNQEIVKNAKNLSTGSICYVTLNKTTASLKESFKKNKVNLDNITFVDCITKSIKKTDQQGDNVYFISSPGALTELSLVINKFLRHKFKYLIFDSLTNMAVYQDPKIVTKFVASIINKVKDSETKAVFYGLKGKEQEALTNETSMFVDKVSEIK